MGVNGVPINYSISSSYNQTNGSIGNSPTSAYGALNMSTANNNINNNSSSQNSSNSSSNNNNNNNNNSSSTTASHNNSTTNNGTAVLNSSINPLGSVGGQPSSNIGNHPMNSIYSSNICCLIDKGNKCTAAAGNASFSKKIERQVAMRKLKLVADGRMPHTYICEQHKQMIQSVRAATKRKRKDHDDHPNHHDDISNDYLGNSSPPLNSGGGGGNGGVGIHDHHSSTVQQHIHRSSSLNSNNSFNNSSYDIDLTGLQVSTLRRYKKHFRLHTKPGLNKLQLAEEIAKHFRTIQVNEREVINTFMYTIKHNGNKLEFNAKD